MEFDDAKEIFKIIGTSSCQDQWRDLVGKANVYARIRVDWLMADKEKQPALGKERSACHDAFIASCQAMADAMKAAGEDTHWQLLLGTDRKTIGDFACFVHCILGLIAR